MKARIQRSATLAAIIGAASFALGGAAFADAKGAGTAAGSGAASATAPIAMPHGIVPNKSELPKSAFDKLDAAEKGYVTREDVAQLDGFDRAFEQADQNHDGRLNADEFKSAWANYTGQKP